MIRGLLPKFVLLICLIGSAFAEEPDCETSDILSVTLEGKQLPRGLLDDRGRGYALLVGLDKYNSTDVFFGDLKSPVQEIMELRDILEKDHYAVKTLIDEEATLYNISRWLTCFAMKANTSDRLLFYFAGHGGTLLDLQRMMDHNTKEKHWDRINRAQQNSNSDNDRDKLVLILHQPEPNVLSEFAYVDDLTEIISHSKAHQQIVWIDGCYSGNMNKIFDLPLNSYSYRILNEGFIAITGLKDIVYDGLYGRYMLQGLRGAADHRFEGNKDGRVSLSEIVAYIDHHVRRGIVNTSGIPFRSRHIFIGSGSIYLTQAREK